MHRGVKTLQRSVFLRQVSTLSAGTLVAQLILLVSSPVLSRLYSPAEFGVYAFLLACVSVLSPSVCGKYNIAILLPRGNRLSNCLAALSIQVCFFVCLVILIIAILWAIIFEPLAALQNAANWILIIPFMLFFTGLSMVFSSMANRKQDYKLLSVSKIIQAIIVAVINIALGVAGFGFAGLLLGNIAGLFFFNYILYSGLRYSPDLGFNKRKLAAGRKYREFPIFNATPSLLDGVALHLPLFFMSAYYPEAFLGYFALVIRVVNVPLAFISGSVSQINVRKVVGLAHERKSILPYTLKLMLALSCLVFPVVFTLYFFAEPVFVVVFGENWREAGLLASLLVPSLGLRFVVSTLSTTISGTNNCLLYTSDAADE